MGIGRLIQGAQPGALRQPRGMGWCGEWEGGSRGGDTYILMADSHFCMAETNTL